MFVACEFASFLILWLGAPFPSSEIHELVAELLVTFTRGMIPMCLGMSSIIHFFLLVEIYQRIRALTSTHRRQDLEGIGSEKRD
jgi:hypothetical protein